MLVILSPARNIVPALSGQAVTKPLFMAKTMQLVRALRVYSAWQLESLLDVNAERAFTLYLAYQSFRADAPGTPSLLSYSGMAYRNMQPRAFTPAQLAFANNHLRILSALYGVLHPLDGVLPHRLGLQKDFRPGGKTLYDFWGNTLHKELFRQGELVVNLASAEYARLFIPYMRPGDKMVTCRFLVEKPGGARGTVSTVRAARGLMARFMVTQGIQKPEQLREFWLDNYEFAQSRSSETEYVFIKRRALY